MAETLREELMRLFGASKGALEKAAAVKGANDRCDAMIRLCRGVIRQSSLCYIDGDLCHFDGRCYEKVPGDALLPALTNALVDLGIPPTDVRRMGDMPLKVISERSFPHSPAVVFANGVLNTRNGKFVRGFGAETYTFESLPYRYDRKAKCPLWESFLKDVLPDEKMRLVLQEFFGMVYLDRDELSVEKFAIFVGKGANGKSVIFEVLKKVIGDENVSTLDSAQLTDEKMIPYVKGKRLNFCPDVRKSSEFDSALKALASGQDVTGRRIYGDAEKIKCPPMCFALNELPHFRDVTEGFFRRVLLFCFDVQIPPERQDRSLVGKICSRDLPGIFNWIMEGRSRLVATGGQFTHSAKMERDTDAMRIDVSAERYPVRTWLERRGLTIYPQYDGQQFTFISQNEIFLGLRGNIHRATITRELGIFGVTSQKKRGLMYYRVYEKRRTR